MTSKQAPKEEIKAASGREEHFRQKGERLCRRQESGKTSACSRNLENRQVGWTRERTGECGQGEIPVLGRARPFGTSEAVMRRLHVIRSAVGP